MLSGFREDKLELDTKIIRPWRTLWAGSPQGTAAPTRLLLRGMRNDRLFKLAVALNGELHAIASEGLRARPACKSIYICTLGERLRKGSDRQVSELVRDVFKSAKEAPAAIVHVDLSNIVAVPSKDGAASAFLLQFQKELQQLGDSPKLAICVTQVGIDKKIIDESTFVLHQIKNINLDDVVEIIQGYVVVEDRKVLTAFAERILKLDMQRRNVANLSRRAADKAHARVVASDPAISLLSKSVATAGDLVAALDDEVAYRKKYP